MVKTRLLHGSAGSRGTTAATGQLQTHRFALFLWLSLLCLSPGGLAAQTIQTNLAVIVQHSPWLNGRGTIQGSLQQLDGENVTLNSGFLMTGDLLVPGTPKVVVIGHPNYAGIVPGNGSSSPFGYEVVLDRNCSFNYLRTRTTPVTLPMVSNPPWPTGTRRVTITRSGQSYGNPDTLRDLTLAGRAGLISVPPGTYGDFTVCGGSGLAIGVAGAVQPVAYNLQNLTLIGNATLNVVGPVILTVAKGFTANGCIGNSNNPAWLQLNIACGNLILNCGSITYGLVTVPKGWVTIGENAMLVGTAASEYFDINDNGIVRWGGSAQILLPPVATNQTVTLAENSSANITLTGFDSRNLSLTYSVLTEPVHGVLSGTPPNLTYQPASNFYGDDSFTFEVNNGVTNSSPATISLVVTQVYYPPAVYSQTLTNLENTALPVTLSGSDPQNYPLTYSILTEPSHGTISGTPPNLVYQPAANYFGNDSFTFDANDGVSNSAPGTISITVEAVDEPPVVSAGSNQLIILPNNTANLNGTVIYTEFPNTVDTVLWSKVSGPGTVTFGDASSTTTAAIFSTNGIYVLQLYASDSFLSASNSLKVIVDSPPVVNAGVTQTNLFPGAAQLSGMVTDDGLPSGQLTWSWSVVSGPGTVTFNNAALTNATATFSQPGLYVLQLTASDSAAVGSNQVAIIEDAAPSVQLATNEVPDGTNQLVLTATVTDDGLPAGAELTTTWGLVSGPAAVAFSAAVQTSPLSGVSVTNVVQSLATFSVAGTYVVSLTADDSFATNSSTVSLSVASTPLLVYAGPDLYLSGVPATTTLNGQVTDAVLPSGGTLSEQWSVVGGPGTVTFGNPASPVTTATFSTNGIYVLQLTANNGQLQASSMVEVRVETECTVEDPEALAAWWPANGNAVDVVSGEQAILNGAGYTNGEVALAFNFDGSDEFVDVPAATNYDVGSSPAGFSLEFWTKGTPGYTCGVLGWSSGVLMVEGGGNNGLYVDIVDTSGNGHSLNAVANVFDGQWHHVAVTYDQADGVADVYKDGVIQVSQGIGSFQPQTSHNLYMGQVPGYSDFKGELDEISLYRRPLNPEEVYSIYASGSVGKCPDDTNAPPMVSAGPDLFLGGVPATATLNGQVSDPALPPGGTLSQQWTVLGGPGTVAFGSPNSPVTTAMFGTNGIYVLQLTADNGEAQSSSLVEVRVETLCTVEDPEGLAAWWPADGTAEDVLSGNYGILSGGTSYTNGEVALAFNFDGTDQFVDVPAATNYNVGSSPLGFSVEFWTKGTPVYTCGVLGWNNGVLLVEGGGNNGLYVNIVDTNGNSHSLNSVVNVFDGQWHHVAVTYDRTAGIADVYKDGVMMVSQSIGSFQPQTTNDFYMGQVSGYSDFKGELDEISLYQRPLDPEEVYSIYASGSVGKCPDTNILAVYAGSNFAVSSPTNALLNGSVTENGQAAGTNVEAQWTEYYGPGPVLFSDPASAISPVTFSTNGIYILQLTANNADEESSGLVEVRVGVPCDDESLPGLSAWWPADGTAEDIIGGAEAILGGGASYTNGEVALAFNFDGVDDFVLAPAATNYNVGASPAGFSVEFWTKGTPGYTCGVLGWSGGVSLVEGGGNNGLNVNIVDTSGNSHSLNAVVNVFDGQWHHVAVTYDRVAGVADVYKDGVMQVSQSIGSFQPQTSGDCYMGQVAGNAYFRGQLDEISLYSMPLSSSDVVAIYASGSAGKCPNN